MWRGERAPGMDFMMAGRPLWPSDRAYGASKGAAVTSLGIKREQSEYGAAPCLAALPRAAKEAGIPLKSILHQKLINGYWTHSPSAGATRPLLSPSSLSLAFLSSSLQLFLNGYSSIQSSSLSPLRPQPGA